MKKKIRNLYDETLKELWDDMWSARTQLEAATRKVVVRKGVIDLYPEGADQEKAIKDYDKAKLSLLSAIGRYDGRMQELREYYSTHCELLDAFRNWQDPSLMPDSHEIIENAYKEIIGR